MSGATVSKLTPEEASKGKVLFGPEKWKKTNHIYSVAGLTIPTDLMENLDTQRTNHTAPVNTD